MIVALQTAGSQTSLWLLESDETAPAKPTRQWESGRQLADELPGAITSLLKDHGKELLDVTGFVIFSGPGSFTSLRIGHTVANALADSLGVPVTGAAGEGWLATGQAALATTPAGRPALPLYGSEAHVTKPKSAH